jgi:predicted transcriptional regulator
MHVCEQVVSAAKFLEKSGLTQKQLTSLHHFSLQGKEERLSSLIKYFSVNKNLRDRNIDLANRIIFVANRYRLNNGTFSQLIKQALEKWPLP